MEVEVLTTDGNSSLIYRLKLNPYFIKMLLRKLLRTPVTVLNWMLRRGNLQLTRENIDLEKWRPHNPCLGQVPMMMLFQWMSRAWKLLNILRWEAYNSLQASHSLLFIIVIYSILTGGMLTFV